MLKTHYNHGFPAIGFTFIFPFCSENKRFEFVGAFKNKYRSI